MNDRRLIVLSPHLDDAVLSLGGTIARECAAGNPALIATFFTAAPAGMRLPRHMEVFADFPIRKAEDEDAMVILGAQARHYDLVEQAFCQTSSGPVNVFRTPGTRNGFPNLSRLKQAIEELIDAHPQAQIRAPLGIGNHFDHVEIFLAALDVMVERNAADRFAFYEDFYAVSGLNRRRHFIARCDPTVFSASACMDNLRLMALLGMIAIARRGPDIRSYLSPVEASLEWRLEHSPIAGFDEKKLAAVCAYASQVAPLGGLRSLTSVYRGQGRPAYAAEPIWHATDGLGRKADSEQTAAPPCPE